MTKLVSVTVTGASQKNVTGDNVWAAVLKKSSQVLVEARTGPKGTPDEWKLIKWSGGKPVKNRPNQCMVSRDVAGKVTVKIECEGASQSIDVWIVSASIEVLTQGMRPKGAAPRDKSARDETEKLGAVTYPSMMQNPINDTIAEDDPDASHFVNSTAASGKIVAVCTLKPAGISKVIKAGWTFRRELFCHTWMDGLKVEGSRSWTSTWINDTSGPTYLRLTPDDGDKIYDLDEPDMPFGRVSTEMYNNFRQWVEWNGESCSDYALWHFNVRWRAKADPKAQIELNQCGKGNLKLPDKGHYPPPKARGSP